MKKTYSKKELRELIEQDYKVRNENPHYLVHNNVISFYSYDDFRIKGKKELWEDSYIDPKDFNCTIEEAEKMFIENGFVNINKLL